MSVMDEKDSELLGRIAPGEDSVLELKRVEFRGNRIIGPRRSDMADEQAVPSTSIDDLNPRLWKRFRTPLSSENNREFLEKMRLITRDISGEGGDAGEFRPSVAGILMTSDAPESSIPNAFIQAVCYRGTRRSGSYQLDADECECSGQPARFYHGQARGRRAGYHHRKRGTLGPSARVPAS